MKRPNPSILHAKVPGYACQEMFFPYSTGYSKGNTVKSNSPSLLSRDSLVGLCTSLYMFDFRLEELK